MGLWTEYIMNQWIDYRKVKARMVLRCNMMEWNSLFEPMWCTYMASMKELFMFCLFVYGVLGFCILSSKSQILGLEELYFITHCVSHYGRKMYAFWNKRLNPLCLLVLLFKFLYTVLFFLFVSHSSTKNIKTNIDLDDNSTTLF